jgi:DNA-binding MarR family transcriptional regulator
MALLAALCHGEPSALPKTSTRCGHIESANDAGQVFALADFLPYRLSVVTNRISRAFAHRYAETFDLTIAEWRVLAVVGNFAPMSASDVCIRTAMDKVKVSRAVARLVKRNFLVRRVDPDDNRMHSLVLSRRGRGVYDGVVPMALALEHRLTSALTKDERAALIRILGKLEAYVDDLEGAERAERV